MESNEKNSKLNIFKGYTKVGEVGNGNNNDFIKIKNKKRINSRKDISDEICIYPSEEKVFYIRDQLYKKETKNIDYKVEEKEKEKEEINTIEGNEVVNEEKRGGKKGFFKINFGWINYLINEIPLLWKKEELVKGYDANGNVVYRPKKKIPMKEKNNNHDINKMNAENEANSAGVDYSQKGINYGIYFN